MSESSSERVSFIPSPDEKRKMKVIKDHYGLIATTELVRFCITQTYNQITNNSNNNKN